MMFFLHLSLCSWLGESNSSFFNVCISLCLLSHQPSNHGQTVWRCLLLLINIMRQCSGAFKAFMLLKCVIMLSGMSLYLTVPAQHCIGFRTQRSLHSAERYSHNCMLKKCICFWLHLLCLYWTNCNVSAGFIHRWSLGKLQSKHSFYYSLLSGTKVIDNTG